MQARQYQSISAETLLQRMQNERPDNVDASTGYALVNVLAADAFEEEHIPASINIPKGNESYFENRFSKDKEIIVYCASTDCDASPAVAEKLASRGFSKVHDFEAGLDGWKRIDGPVESSATA